MLFQPSELLLLIWIHSGAASLLVVCHNWNSRVSLLPSKPQSSSFCAFVFCVFSQQRYSLVPQELRSTAAQLPSPCGSPSSLQNTQFSLIFQPLPPKWGNQTKRRLWASKLLGWFGQVAFVWQGWAGKRHLLCLSNAGSVIGRIMFGRKIKCSGLNS